MSSQARKRGLETTKAEEGFVEPVSSENQSRNTNKSRKLSSISQAQAKPRLQVDEQGVEFWEISKSRRVNVTEFAGQNMINIREFYEKNGKTLPGKKGISLTIPQFTALVLALPEIHVALKEKGEHISLPQFTESTITNQKDEPEKDEDEQSSDQKSIGKRNYDATSDEDEG